jgi:hypothetical protein
MEPETQAYSSLTSRALYVYISMTRMRLLCELASLHIINLKIFENHTAVDNNNTTFRDVIPCNLVDICQRFVMNSLPHSSRSSDYTVISIYRTTRRHIPQDFT